MECVWDAALLQRADQLPAELLHIIQNADPKQYVESITQAVLDPRYSYILFAHCENIFAHVCATLRTQGDLASAIATLGRVVPFAPYLLPYAERLLATEHYDFSSSHNSNDDLLYLLGLFRLFAFKWRTFKKYVKPDEISTLLDSPSRPTVYLAIRILQIYLSGADHWFEQMINQYLGPDTPESNIDGVWDDKVIDYRFLTLWEEERFEKVLKLSEDVRSQSTSTLPSTCRIIQPEYFDASTALVGGILMPKLALQHEPSRSGSEQLVSSATVTRNLQRVASTLKSSQPILLTGLPGCGKTALARSAAQQLGALDKMVTLHLNEQSDSKLLLGIHTTGDTPGSFVWKPGVLTTAVQEGRWILIEDLDRAPNEIISTLLPLIEKRELLIPNRKQTIYAAQEFRIIATVRSTIDYRGEETNPLTHMLGARHWQRISVEMPSMLEWHDIAAQLYPSLGRLLPQLMAVYESIQTSRQRAVLEQSRTGILRPTTPRDFLKWCSRVTALNTDQSPATANFDEIFMEAIDCFIGALPDCSARTAMVAVIAENLQIDPDRRDFLLTNRTVRYEIEKSRITVGRYSLPRSIVSKKGGAEATFSTDNPHTKRMLERVAAASTSREPLLLVGETGVGKTAAVQHLASALGKNLIAFNLSQQSEAGDLLGGFKPVSARSLIIPLKDEFDELFSASFAASKNQQFQERLSKHMIKEDWKAVCKFWRAALDMVEKQREASTSSRQGEAPSKKRKVEAKMIDFARWDSFADKVSDMEKRLAAGPEAFAFSFVEGSIVKAVRNGDWVLLDEINLASTDTLESITDLFDSRSPSILLAEAGDIQRVDAHPDFRVFAAMNPATDVGKRDLPPGIRSRFTELYVGTPDKDLKSLQSIVRTCLGHEASSDQAVALDTSVLYQKIIELAEQNKLVDGAGQRPHFSLRTLTRTLSFARYIAALCSLRRALYEGFQMSFLTLLDAESAAIIQPLLERYLFGKRTNLRAELQKALRKPNDGYKYVQGYPGSKHWARRSDFEVEEQSQYILTPFIRTNLENLIRATSTRQFPVLIQGPTSSGKTSMIEYLAKRTGHKFVRINNHEHTDIQEYMGTYISDTDGRLRFQEGLLVKAIREGHWIVLDELNLAPSDVLEALNRLLDDNRELLIPETQEVVRPHPNFMLFATQNPAGLYGGRKTLSRAFRNRFLELHFDDIPIDELQEILHRRTQLPESRCKRIVNVYRELSILRQQNRLFEQKSFATLRDLFRWALRPNDTIEELAANGFMLLAERVRKAEERQTLKGIIEDVMSRNGPRVTIDESALYASNCAEIRHYQSESNDSNVVWTKAMRRLYVLVSRAMRNDEPVLLVGDTGCGKTTVCQMLAHAFEKELHMVNAHQNTETGDLIGSQRPVRNRAVIEADLRRQLLSSWLLQDLETASANPTEALLDLYDRAIESLGRSERDVQLQSPAHKRVQILRTRMKALFEWNDGALVQAMKDGSFFLLDEISLADDSVLERINSALEPQRSILLAEKGSLDSYVVAASGFQLFATMNPGGDYGKHELSPALRNRFTEIWVPPLDDVEDVKQIVNAKLVEPAKVYTHAIVAFAQWFNHRYNTSASSSISIRDALAWVEFVNVFAEYHLNSAIVHGAAMVYIDTLGANPAGLVNMSRSSLDEQRTACLSELSRFLGSDADKVYWAHVDIELLDDRLTAGPFSAPRQLFEVNGNEKFSFQPHTTKTNTMRVLRALQLSKPIILEGNPGVGKTALITAIAEAVGMPLTRINLSEQTDLIDLFGSDVPIEGEGAGTFAWRDAPFLRAMQRGEWVLLDEMNLASQSVLEGLNACLDHRGEVYIPELSQSFRRHPQFRLFAAQNPHHQGGGRKGLPASFVNRFTVVFADAFSADDLLDLCIETFPQTDRSIIQAAVQFVEVLDSELGQNPQFGTSGRPWEFNLRDLHRWLSLASGGGLLRSASPHDVVDFLFSQRFRTTADKMFVSKLFSRCFQDTHYASDLFASLSTQAMQLGIAILPRNPESTQPGELSPKALQSRSVSMPILQSVMLCVQRQWPVILTGPSGAGKTLLVEHLAAAVGASVTTITMNSDTDVMDLLGGYEQSDLHRRFQSLTGEMLSQLETQTRNAPARQDGFRAMQKLSSLAEFDHNSALAELSDDFARLADSTDQREIHALLRELQQAYGSVDQARFEWVDGLLIEALQKGKWLVLDNANLCSPSVLDRLNSLLEPSGVLLVNEHGKPDGSPQAIRPHPDFRIFLTLDPRYGELSRAMRNRAVELYLPEPDRTRPSSWNGGVSTESALARLRPTKMLSSLAKPIRTREGLLRIAYDHTGIRDQQLMPRFQHQLRLGLYPPLAPEQSVQLDVLGLPSNQSEDLQKFYTTCTSQLQVSADFAGVQTLHPLNNQALVHMSPPAFLLALSLATAHDAGIALSSVLFPLQSLRDTPQAVSRMRRLERSINIQPSPTTHSKRSVVIDLIEGLLKSLLQCSNIVPADSPAKLYSTRKALSDISFVCAAFVGMLSNESTDASQLVAFITVAKSNILSYRDEVHSNISPRLDDGYRALLSAFSAASNNRGRACTALWMAFKPRTPATYNQLRDMIRFETALDRFDHACQQFESPIESMATLRGSVTRNLEIAVDNGEELKNLSEKFEKLLSTHEISNETSVRKPHFHQIFCGLHEHISMLMLDVKDLFSQGDLAAVALLAMQGVRDGVDYHYNFETGSGHRLFQLLRLSIGAQAEERTTVKLTADVLQRAGSARHVTLGHRDLLKDEVKILSTLIGSRGYLLATPELLLRNSSLERLFSRFLLALSTIQDDKPLQAIASHILSELKLSNDRTGLHDATETLRHLSINPDSRETAIFTQLHTVAIHLRTDYADRHTATVRAAEAWASLAFFGLQLYICEVPFDPAMEPKLKHAVYVRHHDSIITQLQALEAFRVTLTKQADCVRAIVLNKDLQNLGSEPPYQPIYRPNVPQVSEIYSELEALIRILKPFEQRTGEFQGDLLSDSTINNVVSVRKRLFENFRAYEDFTAPIIALIDCLLVAQRLIHQARAEAAVVVAPAQIQSLIPFAGATFERWRSDEILISNASSNFTANERLLWLDVLGARSGIWPLVQCTARLRQTAQDQFHHFYVSWKTKLDHEQQQAGAKRGLYKFEGQVDDSDPSQEELDEYFNSNETLANTEQPQELAQLIATLHSSVYISKPIDSKQISGLLHRMSTTSSAHVEELDLMPAALWSLAALNDPLPGDTRKPQSYNIYRDSNSEESQKLLALLKRISSRFKQLHEVWPEHATPVDVIVLCEELLGVEHTAPLMRLLPKVEKLHATVNEWQKITSREYSALEIFEELTSLIVQWRQLELSTWLGLFTQEWQQCERDAASWWYIAYETIVGATTNIATHPQHLKVYVQDLLKTLCDFLVSCSLGEFSSRLRMLQGFEAHLAVNEIDNPPLRLVRITLSHLLAYYRHFEPAVFEALSTGRSAHEEEVSKVVQLASWKDRNIDILRQSATSSHKKLLRLVRKYRLLLAQPASHLLQGELPSREMEPTVKPLDRVQMASAGRDASSDTLGLPIWDNRPNRYRHVTDTATSILSEVTEACRMWDGASKLALYMKGLQQSIMELQKATPAALTEKNRALVNHLRTRKRRLLADVLKDLRQMGLRPSMNQQTLDQQSSLDVILTHLAEMGCEAKSEMVAATEYNFHRFLNIMTATRQASRKHSNDLTAAEVARCMTLLESLLEVDIEQYSLLCSRFQFGAQFDNAIEQFHHLTRCEDFSTPDLRDVDWNSMLDQMTCVGPVLAFCIDTIQLQERMSGCDYSEVITWFMEKAAELEGIRNRSKNIARLPSRLITPEHSNIRVALNTIFQDLRSTSDRVIARHPELSPVVFQLRKWIERDGSSVSSSYVNGHALVNLETWVAEMLATVDLIVHSIRSAQKVASGKSSKDESKLWLVEQKRSLNDSFNALDVENVATKLSTLLVQLQHLDCTSEAPRRTVLAICKDLLPIFDAYQDAIRTTLVSSSEICTQMSRMGYHMSKSFIQLSSQGFCTPSENAKDSKQDGQVESGTGLGEGTGTEDISKDVGDEEDLSEIAQEKEAREEGEELNEEKDAVDMADEEMEGEIGDVKSASNDDEDDENKSDDDVDGLSEEPGSVNADNENSVDETTWDGDPKKEYANKEASSGHGTEDKDDLTAQNEANGNLQDQTDQNDVDNIHESEIGTEEVERTSQEKLDPHAEQEQNLELPADIDMDGKQLGDSDESEIGSTDDQTPSQADANLEAASEADEDTKPMDGIDSDVTNDEAMQNDVPTGEDAQEAEDQTIEDAPQDVLMQDSTGIPENDALNDLASSETGIGPEKDEKISKGQSAGRNIQDDLPQSLQDSSNQIESGQGNADREDGDESGGRREDIPSSETTSSFKQLYDASEQWYDQHKPIQEARRQQNEITSEAPARKDPDMANAEFEHLPDAEADYDTQALGTASVEQSSALQQDNSIPVNDSVEGAHEMPLEDTDDQQPIEENIQSRDDPDIHSKADTRDVEQSRSFVGHPRPLHGDADMIENIPSPCDDVDEQIIEQSLDVAVQDQLTYDEAHEIWAQHEERTRNLAMILTEHLRLILQPTKATKLRGDFRTGKRLNIKRIISYIASSYKRDKIWMRRSVPSKRSYQIMLAIDDSQSMTENQSRDMAFDTLALVARSMSMLEVGELSVIGFGENVKVAHDFSTHFPTDTGAQVLQQFSFSQIRTNVRRLLAQSIELFRTARLKATGSTSDLWQLQLIISDGLCEDHPSIRQLVRQAYEERIMIVFIIIDSATKSSSSENEPRHSITNQPTAEFVKDEAGEMQLKMGQYLDTFPFRYYLIVQNIEELPEVLAGALRQWFAEVVDIDG